MRKFSMYIFPICTTLLCIAAFARKSMTPAIFNRYSYGYMLFLILMITLSTNIWIVVLNKPYYQRFTRRLSQIPIFPLTIIGGGILGMALLFWQESHEQLLLLGLNKNLLGVQCVIVLIICISTLASKNSLAQLQNYALLVASCLVTFLFGEIGYRIVAHSEPKFIESIQQTANMPKPEENIPLGRMIRFHSNPRIIYELIPNLSAHFLYQPVTIDASGFRRISTPAKSGKPSVRILGLGDSVMFGWGVKGEETYLSRLSERLNKAFPSVSWEIVNTAVPGYNTVMEVETLKEKGLALKPDLVLIEYVGNDLSLPNFIRKPNNYLTFKKSFLKDFLFSLNQNDYAPEGLEQSLQFGTGSALQDPQRVPVQYRDMVGEEAYYNAMEELNDLRRKHGFEVIVVSLGPPPSIKRICTQLGFETIGFYRPWLAFARKEGITDTRGAWKLNPNDPHPSVLAHKVIGDTIFKALKQRGHLEKLQTQSQIRPDMQ